MKKVFAVTMLLVFVLSASYALAAARPGTPNACNISNWVTLSEMKFEDMSCEEATDWAEEDFDNPAYLSACYQIYGVSLLNVSNILVMDCVMNIFDDAFVNVVVQCCGNINGEICDGIDNNINGIIDEGCASVKINFNDGSGADREVWAPDGIGCNAAGSETVHWYSGDKSCGYHDGGFFNRLDNRCCGH